MSDKHNTTDPLVLVEYIGSTNNQSTFHVDSSGIIKTSNREASSIFYSLKDVLKVILTINKSQKTWCRLQSNLKP